MNQQPIDFYDIYSYHYVPWHQKPTVVILLGLLIAVLVGGGLVYFFMRRRHYQLQPWEWAYHEISKLRVDAYETKQDYKQFYFDITHIIKTYLHKRYEWDTEDKTDEELLEFLKTKGFNKSLRDNLQKMFEGALWVKFANEQALKNQVVSDLATARTLVKKTEPKN